ncbi:hypothetical protein SAMN05421736_11289 [Evansella caseinilytica]|uniref:Uncharacterized protein n=1 Tax=Evansella caseinilytica TaxID=1503961 RepID=A0A1H3SVW6_9BACI|nr:hypothetical protein [Evansella caseinilytica]SDZ42243.1 hypothetical protein SAMN05421736_11289 [Evansella caseinilytica]
MKHRIVNKQSFELIGMKERRHIDPHGAFVPGIDQTTHKNK